MRKFLTGCAALLMTAGIAMADPVEGVWKSPTNGEGQSIQVKVAKCGANVCGSIVKVTKGDQSLVGKRMIWGMAPQGGGSYTGGKVWAPDNQKTYNGKLALSGSKLKISGCVLGICRGETFRRVK